MTAVAAGRRVEAAALRGVAVLAEVRPLYVVGGFVVLQWLATLGVALTVHHDGWLYHPAPDQVSSYATSVHLRHGSLPPTHAGFGWPVLLLPFALVSGSTLHDALPGIVLVNVLLLVPAAMAALYGIGRRLGGALFGYWVLLLWIALPFVGSAYTDAGFKQRFSEFSLPQSLGLTAGTAFPQMVALTAAAYFTLRALQGRLRWDAAFAGLLAGAAVAIRPSSALCLCAVALAVVACRRFALVPAFAAGLLPPLLALAFWRWQALGHVPISPGFGSLHWAQIGSNLDSVQEHFWSKRVLEWTLLAGTVALARRGLTALVLFGGWLWAFLLFEGSRPQGSLETGALLPMLIPAIPAFVLLVACLPLLLPGVPARLPQATDAREWRRPRVRTALFVAGVLLFAVVPVVLAAVA